MILSPSYQKMLRLGVGGLILGILTPLLPGCTYRFSNLYLQPPEGVHSIAIEAIYDTSRSVVAHEKLWEGLQREFAADGRLRLAAPGEADAYLRAQLLQADLTPGNVQGDRVLDPLNPGAPPRLYRDLKRADRYATGEGMQIVVHIELWQRATGKLLLARKYSAKGSHKVYNPAIPIESHYLTASESRDLLFEGLARDLAKKVVRDFLSLRSPVY